MDGNNSLVNLGDLSKPATVLIEKVSEAVGGVFRPYQIKRIAKAEAEASKIKAMADIEISELQQRAFVRFLNEETRKQINIEEITAKAAKKLDDNAEPEKLDEDWIADFFEKCRNVSNNEMQELWAKLLAGEANKPGTYSKRTIDFVSILDKTEAELFTTLCSYAWYIGNITLLVFDSQDEIYTQAGINFNSLKDLDSMGLISFDPIGGYRRVNIPQNVTIFYYGTPLTLEFKKDKNDLEIGKVLLTKLGLELAPICNSVRNDDFFEYVMKKYFEKNIAVSMPWYNQQINPTA